MITVVHLPVKNKVAITGVANSRQARYVSGYDKPNYPVPAIPVSVEIHSWAEPSPFHSSVVWVERREFCSDCDGLVRNIVAIVDFNWDRCMDFNYGVGVYVAGQELEDGLDLYLKETKL